MRDRNMTVVGALIGVFAVNLIHSSKMIQLTLDLAEIDHFAVNNVHFVASCAWFAAMLVTVFALLPRLGPRWLSAAGGWITGVGFGLGALALHLETYWTLIPAAVLGGAGTGMVICLPITMLVRRIERRDGLWIGIAYVVGGAAVQLQFSTIWSGPLTADPIGATSTALLAQGSAAVVLLTAAGWLVRDRVTGEDAPDARARFACGPGLGRLLRSGRVWLLAGLLGLAALAWDWQFVHGSISSLAVEADLEWLTSPANTLLLGALTASAALLFGWLSDLVNPWLLVIGAVQLLVASVLASGLDPGLAWKLHSFHTNDTISSGLELLGLVLAARLLGALAYPRVWVTAFALAAALEATIEAGYDLLTETEALFTAPPALWIPAAGAYLTLAILALFGWRTVKLDRNPGSAVNSATVDASNP